MGWFGEGKYPSVSMFDSARISSTFTTNLHILDSPQANASQQYQDADPNNQASFTHELIAGAASYEAAKAYENHCAANGTCPSFPPCLMSLLSLMFTT